jgi:hypothetical protein
MFPVPLKFYSYHTNRNDGMVFLMLLSDPTPHDTQVSCPSYLYLWSFQPASNPLQTYVDTYFGPPKAPKTIKMTKSHQKVIKMTKSHEKVTKMSLLEVQRSFFSKNGSSPAIFKQNLARNPLKCHEKVTFLSKIDIFLIIWRFF